MEDWESALKLIGAFVVLISFFTAIALGTTLTIQPAYVIPIASLSDNSKISGSFMLGSGSIESEPVFVVYSQLRNGGYQLETYPVDKCTIYMDSDTLPHIQVYNTVITFYALRMTVGGDAISLYDIHVPRGTIVQQYRLDGQI